MDTTFFNTFGTCKIASRKPTKLFGTRPLYEFRFNDRWLFDRKSTPALKIVPDICGVGFDANLTALASQARRPLDGLEVDFIWLAVAVYLADRCAPRYPYGARGPAHWRRRIHLEIPVSDAVVWEQAKSALFHVLEFLTEDDWTFAFVAGRSRFSAERQRHFPKTRESKIDWCSLFSGGLDSLAGALHWLARTNGTGLLISGQTHSRIAAGQRLQFNGLHEHFASRIEHVGIGYGFPDKQQHGLEGFESTQRTRAFIHTALGSIAALMAGNEQLLLFENGIGAFNLPCDSAQFGSQSSRGTHPVFLRRMAALVSAVFSRSFAIVNPFTLSTKAQMLSASTVRHFTSLLQQTFSCDRYPNYKHSETQCGCCPSCLIRRLSFHASGVPDDSKNYTIDILNPRRSLHEGELRALVKLTVQANSLFSAIHAESPWPTLCAKWPDLLRTEIELNSPTVRESVINLLQRHVDEWRSFSSGIHFDSLALAA